MIAYRLIEQTMKRKTRHPSPASVSAYVSFIKCPDIDGLGDEAVDGRGGQALVAADNGGVLPTATLSLGTTLKLADKTLPRELGCMEFPILAIHKKAMEKDGNSAGSGKARRFCQPGY